MSTQGDTFKRNRKVQYGFYKNSNAKHPVIHMRGKYLQRYGFAVGDEIEVTIETEQIVIRKVQPSSPQRE